MSVAAHIAAQRTDHAVPHAVSCRALGVPPSTFYKWRDRPPTPSQRRRAELDALVKAAFDASDGTYGSPRVHAQLRRDGHTVTRKTVEAPMARQGPASTGQAAPSGPDPPRQGGEAGAGPAQTRPAR